MGYFPLGKGAYGDVFFDSTTGFAVKRMLHTLESSEGLSVTAMRESRLLRVLTGHPNIMSLYNVRMGENHLFLEIEYLPHSLRNILDGCRVCRRAATRMCHDLFSGLAHCHLHGIMHRDIKPENLLFSHSCQLKLVDFGLAREVLDTTRDDELRPYTPQMVTLWYRAPEILMNEPYGVGVDIWSAGCVVGEIYLGRTLFQGDSEIAMLKLTSPSAVNVVKQLFEEEDEDALELVSACLRPAAERITANDAFTHKLLRNMHDSQC